MMYNILEAKIEFKDGKLDRITVLVEISENDVRAILATTKPVGGYQHILPKDKISDELLQGVAGYGYGMSTIDRDLVFPNWRKKYSK